jgi:hypothetical protein
VTMAVKRSVYFFNPRSMVDRPVPPPMAAIFGPAAQREDALLSYIIGISLQAHIFL